MWAETTPPRMNGYVIAAAEGNKIIAIQCSRPREIFIYNIDTGIWRKYVISEHRPAPPYTASADSVVIGSAIFMFGGQICSQDKLTNDVWKFSLSKDGFFEWKEIKGQTRSRMPSPRYHHTVWEYEGRLWSFGGCGQNYRSYLNQYGHIYRAPDGDYNNQLMCFDPVSEEWTNVRCFGTIPRPWSKLASTRIHDTVWLYCMLVGEDNNALYKLDLPSLQWTKTTTGQPSPPARAYYTFTAIDDERIMLHGGLYRMRSNQQLDDVWILDIPSKTWSRHTADKKRYYHTAIGSPYRNVVFQFGGYRPRCSMVSQISLKPENPMKTLKSLALRCVDKHREQLHWQLLPNKFKETLLLPGERVSVWGNRHSSKRLLHPV